MKKFFNLSVLITLLVLTSSALGVAPASAKVAQESEPLSAEKVSPKGLLNPDGTLKLDGSFSGALNLEGWDVHLDPVSGPVFSRTAPPNQWANLGNDVDSSLNSWVTALAVSGTDLYVGGWFTDAGGIATADYIAKWNGTNWSALGSNGAGNGSLNSYVDDLAISGTDLYVGGSFTDVNNNGTVLTEADYLTKWNGTSWSAISSNGAGDGSLNYTVSVLVVSGADLYVGGFFSDVNNNGMVLPAADYVAKWNGTNWSALGSSGTGGGSLDNYVYALAIIGTDLYVGGEFTNVNNNGTVLYEADSLAKWNTVTGNWSALGSNGAGDGSLNNYVYALAVSGTDLYVGGSFTNVNNIGTVLTEADKIAKWNTLTEKWSALGSNGNGDGSLNENEWAISTLAISGTDLYVGGDFTNVNNNGTILPAADYVAKWNGTNWSALGSNGAGNGSLSSSIFALTVSGTDLYVGGWFADVNNNGMVLPAADYIAAYGIVIPTNTPTFADVPFDHPLHDYIEALYQAGYTAGCSTDPLMYCPDTILDRAQSAVFMLRGQMGSTYSPPPAPWDTFADDWTGFEWAEPWAEGMWQEGLTAGCQPSPLMYCPATQLPRVEASVFGLRMKYGVNYTPPAGTGTLFADMTDTSYWGIGWAEQAYRDGLLPACGADSGTGKPLFCPSELVDRAWGAYLIVKAKNIPLP